MTTYREKYSCLQQELWTAFTLLVRQGAIFPELLDVVYPLGIQKQGLARDSEGRYWFYTYKLLAIPDYQLHQGEDLIVGTSHIRFMDSNHQVHELEPDIADLYWLASLLDAARPIASLLSPNK